MKITRFEPTLDRVAMSIGTSLLSLNSDLAWKHPGLFLKTFVQVYHVCLITHTWQGSNNYYFWNILIQVYWAIHKTSMLITTVYAISAYHHWCCEFESRSQQRVQHFAIKFASDLRQVVGFLWVLRFPPPIKLTITI